ncbi:MAG: amidohydrolase [Coxiellaceae bacterium]|nr:amidohydrolase [Coxiellaceae bacterium]
MDFLSKTKSIFKQSQQHRRHLHQHPELSLKEADTSSYCQQVMRDLGYDVRPCWQHGFVADLIFDPNKPFRAWRADMDALPIQEKNTHDFVSKNKGVAHMCGHDSHMTIALTAAETIAQLKGQWTGSNVRFIFQPCEELPPGGAIGMIENGCLENVDEVYGLHNNPEFECGAVVTRSGPFCAAADTFELKIIGRGGHAARPHDTLDPLYVAAQLITSWQSIISRKISPAHSAILSVTQCIAGDTYNVIADQAFLAGTVRTYDKTERDLIVNCIKDSFLPFEKQGYQFQLDYIKGYDAVVNHATGVDRIAAAATQIINQDKIEINTEPVGFGEDFCYYLQHKPGAFFMLGSGNKSKGITNGLHSAQFDIDEDCMPIGAAIACQILNDT